MQLTSGVYYIFKIEGIDEKGIYSDPQNYTVTYSDGKIKRTNPDGTIVSRPLSCVTSYRIINIYLLIDSSVDTRWSFFSIVGRRKHICRC